MKYTKENIVEGIKAKIDVINEPEVIKHKFVKKISEYPIEIEQNILEWINDEFLTNIDCYGESIVNVVNMWNVPIDKLYLVFYGFTIFKESNFYDHESVILPVIGAQCIYD